MGKLSVDKHQFELELTKKIATFKYDPNGYARFAFPWKREEGPLADYSGLDVWQEDLFSDIEQDQKNNPEDSLQYAISSGHGIGKSAKTAILILWWMSTRPHCAGNVTANTWSQLSTKTWRELALWKDRAINGHWFDMTTSRIFHKDHKETWGINALSNSEKNSEAFAGLHSRHNLVIFDEASAIPDVIWEVSEGAMTDGRGLWVVVGNPTRNQGRFKECWGKYAHRWNTRQIDSRQCMMTDKKKLDEWVEDYGEDSDFVRVRVRGVFPRAASDQLIPENVIENSASVEVEPRDYINHPKLLGVDVARGGGDDSVITMRQGPKAEILGTYQLNDLMKLAGKVVETFARERADHIFIDSTGLGAGIYDRLVQLGMPVTGVSFGTKAIDKRMYSNTRAELWGRMKSWMEDGGSIPRDNKLMEELKQQSYGYTEQLQIQLESKKAMKGRGLESPDRADSLATTFFGESLELLRPKVQYKQVQLASAVGWS